MSPWEGGEIPTAHAVPGAVTRSGAGAWQALHPVPCCTCAPHAPLGRPRHAQGATGRVEARVKETGQPPDPRRSPPALLCSAPRPAAVFPWSHKLLAGPSAAAAASPRRCLRDELRGASGAARAPLQSPNAIEAAQLPSPARSRTPFLPLPPGPRCCPGGVHPMGPLCFLVFQGGLAGARCLPRASGQMAC